MSSASILMYVAIGFFALAVICAVLAIVFFFRLDIRGVIGDLTGKTVAREVQTMRAETKQSEESNARKQIPHRMTISTNLSKSKMRAEDATTALMQDENATTLLHPANGATTLLQKDDVATTVLHAESGATTLLQKDAGATTLLSQDAGATTLLEQDVFTVDNNDDETTVLGATEIRNKIPFHVCGSVVVIHTDEVIA